MLHTRTHQSRFHGFSILEVMVAISVFGLATSAIASSIVSSRSLSRQSEESMFGAEAARSMIEAIKAEPFRVAFARYNADPNDDPVGVGTAPGSTFTVRGLNPRDDDPDGAVGTIVFPAQGGQLLESLEITDLGMARDLNGDGVVDTDNHADDYEILPVVVRVEWSGSAGDRSLQFVTAIFDD